MTKSELQHKLSASLHRMDSKYDLFYGGCCLAAAEVAKKLEQADVKYEVVIYHEWKERNPSDLVYRIKNSNRLPGGIDHVAIAVKVPHKSMESCEIGGNYYSDLMGSKSYRRTVVHTMKSDDLFGLYEKGCWNSIYKNSNDKLLRRNISAIVNLYKKEKSND